MTHELTENEKAVLVALSYGSDEYCYAFASIENTTGLDRDSVKKACRGLRDKGLARFIRGLMDYDTARVAGSGYGCTEEGLAVASTLSVELPEGGDA